MNIYQIEYRKNSETNISNVLSDGVINAMNTLIKLSDANAKIDIISINLMNEGITFNKDDFKEEILWTHIK